ncbi:hypothetical protein SUGI_0768560 [Cryptomeria japonica]|nr:hypothetical protein SUGI_0768560 [Cryptomeria japonica]
MSGKGRVGGCARVSVDEDSGDSDEDDEADGVGAGLSCLVCFCRAAFDVFFCVSACSRVGSGREGDESLSDAMCLVFAVVCRLAFAAAGREDFVVSSPLDALAFGGGGLALRFRCGVLFVSCSLYLFLCARGDPLLSSSFSGFWKKALLGHDSVWLF